MKKFKAFLIAIAAMFCFTAGVQAQKVSMTVVDQHYAAQATYYQTIMALLAAVYVVYRIVVHYRRREVNRFMGVRN